MLATVELEGKWKILRIFQGRVAAGFSSVRLPHRAKRLWTEMLRCTVGPLPVLADPPSL